MNIFKKLIRIFTTALSMFGLTGTNSFVPVQSPNAVKQAWVYDEETDTITSDNLWSFGDVTCEYTASSWNGDSSKNVYFSIETYTISFDVSNTSDSTCGLQIYKGSNYIVANYFSTNRKEITFNVSEAGTYEIAFIGSAYSTPSSAGVATFSNVIINIGSTASQYTPYGTYVNKTEYDDLQEDYNNLLSSYNTLQSQYNDLVASHDALEEDYDSLESRYNSLNSDYQDLQASYNALQTQYNNLKTLYDNLIATYTTMSGTNAFMVDNISNMRMVVNGNNQPVPIKPSLFLGSNVPVVSGSTSFTINYNTDIFFRNGTKVALTTNTTLHYDINVTVSLYDVDNNVIGSFDISIVFSEFSENELYIGTYEFLNDVSSIRSIQFDIGNLSLNTTLGVSNFVLASTPYQRGYNDGYLARSDDYYQMLQQYNDEVALYNTLLEEYQAYKNKYNASTEQTAYNNGVNSVGNATGGVLTLIEGVAGVPITILNGLAPFAIWNVPVIQFIITILFFALIIWLVRKFI